MATRRNSLMPSTTTLLFTLHFLSAFLGEVTFGDFVTQGSYRLRNDGKGPSLQVDVVATATVSTSTGSDSRTLSSHIQGIGFDPPSVDFHDQSIGMPKLETIHINNPSTTQTLHLNSISGDSPVFHASFFMSKVLKAGESTTFDVIFLPRVSEVVQTTLYVQTSLGTYDYKVQGVGVANKFRLRSLLGARIPLNATYSPLISMYNPFNSSLQITEMYSSGGELHLELITGQPQGIKSLWEIRPYETKAVGRANFFGRIATNHTSFIRIRTNHDSSPSLVLPVEVEVLESASLFLSREILDFGILKSGESKSLPLYVLNTGSHQVNIKSISVVPENRAIEVEYTSIILKPGSKYTKIAVITFHSDRVSLPEQTSGVFIIKADGGGGYQLEVPFEVSVLHGSLSYEKSKTLFKVGSPPFHPTIHQIPLANRFKVPVVIYDVKLPSKAQEFFNVSSLDRPFILPPDSEWYYPFSVQFLPTSSDCLFNTTLRLYTNSTYFTIPLYCYDGRVKYSVGDEEDTLDYGIVSESETSSKIFTVFNVNPVEVRISRFTVSPGLPHTTVELISLHSTNQSSVPASPPPTPPYFIDVGHSASFRVNVTKPTSKGGFSGEILIHTSFDSVLHVPVYYKTVLGGLKVSPQFVNFEPTFPYRVARVPIYLKNLYQQLVTVSSVRQEPRDARFSFHSTEYLQLNYKENIQIGTAVFDPLHESGTESVYLGMGDNGSWHSTTTTTATTTTPPPPPPPTTTATSTNVGGAELHDPVADLKQLSSLWKTWSSLVEEGANVLNFSYVVKPDVGPELDVPGRAMLVWPQLLENPAGNLIEFPTTTIGSSNLQVVNVTNPSHHPLIIQPVLLHHYSKSKSIVDLFSEQFDLNLKHFDFSISQSNPFTFSTEDVMVDTESSMFPVVLQPDDPYQITVMFSPKEVLVSDTLLLIRNNLTVFDYVVLRGRGIRDVFSIDGIQPGSNPLMFEFTQQMMERCQAGSLFEPMKMSRVFTMYNSGPTLLTLYLVGIGDGGREEGGFSVMNYHREIIIKPNKTKSIEISFTPDFTISQISNTLQFKTSTGTELLFPLLAILPHNFLAVCYAMQPRPEWERTMAWISVPFWICVLVTMVAVVVVQTNFGYRPGVSYHNDKALPVVQATGGPVFDLRDVVPEHNIESNAAKKSWTKPPETLTSSGLPVGITNSKPPEPSSYADSQHRVESGRHPAKSAPIPSEIKIKPASLVQPLYQAQKPQLSASSEPCASEVELCDVPDTSKHAPSDKTTYSALKPWDAVARTQSAPLPGEFTGMPQSDELRPPKPATTESPAQIRPVSSIVTHSTSNTSVKPMKPEEFTPKVVSDIPPHVSAGIESTSPTTGASFPLPSSKKLKGSRKPNSKPQKSSLSIESNSVISAPPPVVVPQVPLPTLESDGYLERKESESSLKSTDSESTGSSADKSDEKEDPEVTEGSTVLGKKTIPLSVEAVSKTKPHQLSLAKEPNTGQTMHIADPSPSIPEAVENEDEPKKDVKSTKSKRKLRQQKKEEKSKKREKEKISRAREKADKSHSVLDDSYSNEQLDDEVVDEVPTMKPNTKPKSSYSPMKLEPTPRNRQKGSSKYVEPIDPRLYVLESDARSADIADNTGERNAHPPPPNKLPLLSIPSTAIKSSRDRGGSSKPQYEDIISDPFSRNPDRSTYARKKTTSKKSDRVMKAGAEGTPSKQTEAENELNREDSKALDLSDESIGDDADSNSTLPDANENEESEVSAAGKLKGQLTAANHSSPHDLAASLLSKMKCPKKSRSDRDKSIESLEDDEEDIDSMKQDVKVEEEVVRLTRPNTLSPIKDSVLSSPSPPLSGDQYKISSLSLDAEPFVPSSNFKSKKHKSEHKHGAQRHEGKRSSRKVDAKDDSRAMRGSKTAPQHGRTMVDASLPAGSMTDKGMIDRAEFYHKHMEKASSHSPPMPYGDPHAYRYDMLYDPQDELRRSSSERDPSSFYAHDIDEAMLSERPRHDPSALDPALVMQKTGRLPTPARGGHRLPGYTQQQQQKMQHYTQAPPGFGHDVPGSRIQQYEEDFKRQQFLRRRKLIRDLYRQEHAALAAVYARNQARKSAEALSSLHHPSRGMFPQEPNKHALTGGNLWDDNYLDGGVSPSTLRRTFDDPTLVGSEAEPRLTSNSYNLGPSQMPVKERTFSETSDIGGEILPNYQSPSLQSPTAMAPPGYKRAPGAEYSRVEQHQPQHEGVGAKESPLMMEHRLGLAWPPEGEGASLGRDWEGRARESWMMDHPSPTSPGDLTGSLGLPGDSISGGTVDLQPNPSNTYALFENQSIWSLNNSGSESSNLLSWAMLGAAQQQAKNPN